MSTTQEVAKGLTSLCSEAKFMEAMQAYYSPDIVSTEPMGEPATVKGIDAVNAKAEWWSTNFEVHGCEVGGPFVNGDQFIVEFKLDATEKNSGKRSVMHETALYTVEDGKIVDEKFFYGG